MAKDIRLLSGRIKTKAQDKLDPRRTDFISLDNVEPNLGSPDSDYRISSSLQDGTRFWMTPKGGGLKVGSDPNNVTQLQGDELTFTIDTNKFTPFDNVKSTSTTLAQVLDDLDSSIGYATSIALSAVLVDSNFNGDGTPGKELSLDSSLEINSITDARFIRADSIGDSNTFFTGDGSLLFNLPIVDSDIDSIARHALTGGLGISYTPDDGVISIDSFATGVTLNGLTVTDDVLISGNLTVTGDQTIVNTQELKVDDALIQLAVGNETSDDVDIGFIGHYYSNTYGEVHTGLFRDASNQEWYLFHEHIESSFDTGTTTAVINRSDVSPRSFKLADLNVFEIDAVDGQFDSATITNGTLTLATSDMTVTNGDISMTNGGITTDSIHTTNLTVFHIDSADSAFIRRLSFDSLDSGVVVPLFALPADFVAAASEDSIDSSRIPDLYLRNDGDDTTTGIITAKGFIGSDLTIDDSAYIDVSYIRVLTGDSATFNQFTGRLIGLADSALSADKLTATKTFEVSGDVTTTTPLPTFDGTGNVDMSVSINNGAVDSDALGTDAVATDKIQDNAVTADKIAPGAVDSDIRALVTKAYLDSANIDADTLDSFNSNQFLRSDVADDVEADLTFKDNVQARFGDGGDLKIYHDTINSFISEVGTGDLYITTNGQEVLIKDSENGKLSAEFIPDSAVDLYYNGNLKFETTDSGAKVTGIFRADSGTLNGNRIITTADFGDGGGINADELDGLNSTQFLRSDSDDSMAGTLFIDDSLSANNITRRNSSVVVGTYGSPTQIPIVKVDASGFVDSVGIAAVAGVDSVEFDSATGKFTVFLATNDSLSANITLDPFTTADLTEDSTALYYTDARADSAARSAISVANIGSAFNIGSGPVNNPASYGLYYDSASGVISFNGLDSDDILTVLGATTSEGDGGETGSNVVFSADSIQTNKLTVFASFLVDNSSLAGTDSGFVGFYHIDSVDSAYIRNLHVNTLTFDSIGTTIPLSALPDSVVSAGTDGTLDSSQIPDLYLRNDGDDSTSGVITAKGFIGSDLSIDDSAYINNLHLDSGYIVFAHIDSAHLDIDSANITTLTGASATFDSLFGGLDGSYLNNSSVGNAKLANSTISISDSNGNSQTVALGQEIAFSEGADIDIAVGGTRTVTITNTSTLDTVTSRDNSTSNAITVGNFRTTGYIRGPSTLTIDPADWDSISGTVRILGDLQVDGTTTTVNSTEVTINDKTLTLADNSASAAVADGAGLIIDGANATWLYKDISVTGSDSAWVSNIRVVAPRFAGNLAAGFIDTGTLDADRIPDDFLQDGDSANFRFIDVDSASIDSAFISRLSGDSARFTDFYGNLTGNVTGDADGADSATTALKLKTARNIAISGPVAGNTDFDGSQAITITVTQQSNSVTLGTHTAGDYVASITAGNGIITSGTTDSENNTVTISVDSSNLQGLFSAGTGVTINSGIISIGQDVATTADVTFAKVTADSVVANNIINIGEATTRDKLTIGGASAGDLFGITLVDPSTATSGGHVSYRDSNETLTLGKITSSVKSHAVVIDDDFVGIFNENPSVELDVTGGITASATITANQFNGGGSNLTDLNADALTSGTVDSARISGPYPGITSVGTLDDGEISSTFGDIDIGNSYFTGDGRNITNLDAGELINVTGVVPSSVISGSYTGITEVGALVAGSIDSNFGAINIGTSIFTGDGSGLFNVDAATIGGLDPTDLSRIVVTTSSTGPTSTGQYAKIATYGLGAGANGTFLYALLPEGTGTNNSGATILSVQMSKGSPHTATVEIMAMGGPAPFNDDAFRIVNTGSASSPELWIQSNISGVVIQVFEITRHQDAISVTYNDGATWQSTTPSTNGTPVISNGLTYRGDPILTAGADIDSANINNPIISGDVILPSVVTFDDGSGDSDTNRPGGDTLLKHGSTITQNTTNTVTLDENDATKAVGGKYLISAQRGIASHMTEINFVVANNNTVHAAEFGTVTSLGDLFSVEMDVSGGNVRLRITPDNTSKTIFKFSSTVFYDDGT